jgi:hypothetical protein
MLRWRNTLAYYNGYLITGVQSLRVHHLGGFIYMLKRTNTLAYYIADSITEVKSLKVQAPDSFITIQN